MSQYEFGSYRVDPNGPPTRWPPAEWDPPVLNPWGPIQRDPSSMPFDRPNTRAMPPVLPPPPPIQQQQPPPQYPAQYSSFQPYQPPPSPPPPPPPFTRQHSHRPQTGRSIHDKPMSRMGGTSSRMHQYSRDYPPVRPGPSRFAIVMLVLCIVIGVSLLAVVLGAASGVGVYFALKYLGWEDFLSWCIVVLILICNCFLFYNCPLFYFCYFHYQNVYEILLSWWIKLNIDPSLKFLDLLVEQNMLFEFFSYQVHNQFKY